ncbi:hypothetical protein DFA_10725 [Cavenderia fasciculata]|uniref:Tetratricopeptide-like helical domain-containing protein n=1 Tax=Cavenderia fasciculata TaxID=261658 RepID=F4QB80_CACFS|nr:uncharacterized protein DFA_10725 [Cavenderia fasciculata]EGG14852.1 hypothetical protein DFA_10725 [Cavenderia fasciculata]|eukprot:XP_004351368.1 hypothetical protein DFA_10725 [Cavenderia fasciculata]
MENWISFIDTVKSISIDESKENLQVAIAQFDLPDSFREVISSAALLILEAYKTNKTAGLQDGLKTLSDIEKSCPKQEGRVKVCFYIGNILLGFSTLFPKDGSIKVELLQGASEYYQKVIALDPKHMESLQNLNQCYIILSQCTDDTKRMYFSTRSKELGKFIEDVKSGAEVKLSPSSYAKILQAYQYKEKGAEYFKNGDFVKAIQQYHFAKNYINGLMDLTDDKTREIDDLKNVLLNNIAVCLIKQNKFDRALVHLTEVIATDPDNVKALFRRGKSHTAIGNFDQAQEDLARAQSLSPSDKEIQHEIDILNKKSKTLRDRQAAAYSKVFDD